MFPILKTWAVIGLCSLLTERQEAATTIWQFEVTINSASPEGSLVSGDRFQGHLSYQETLSPTIAAPDLELEFQFNGQTFQGFDDRATGYPLFIQDPEPALTFCVDLESKDYPVGSFFHIYPDNSFQYSLDGVSEYEGLVAFQVIPEPCPLALLLSSSIILLFFYRRRPQV